MITKEMIKEGGSKIFMDIFSIFVKVIDDKFESS